VIFLLLINLLYKPQDTFFFQVSCNKPNKLYYFYNYIGTLSESITFLGLILDEDAINQRYIR